MYPVGHVKEGDAAYAFVKMHPIVSNKTKKAFPITISPYFINLKMVRLKVRPGRLYSCPLKNYLSTFACT